MNYDQARQQAIDTVQAAMQHSILFGCHMEVGLRIGGNGWRCKAGLDCPSLTNPHAPKDQP